MFTYRQNSHFLLEILLGGHDRDVPFLTVSINTAVSRTRNEKICNLALTCGRIAKIPSSYRKSGSGNTRLTSGF